MIEVNNLTRSRVDKKFLKRVAQIVLRGENKKESNLSIVLLGLRKMGNLNKKYRGRNLATDVLSFAFTNKFPVIPGIEIGEVVICPEIVKKNAKKFKTTFNKELARALTHGLLHLLGYEHEKGRARAKKMQEKQEYYLSQV